MRFNTKFLKTTLVQHVPTVQLLEFPVSVVLITTEEHVGSPFSNPVPVTRRFKVVDVEASYSARHDKAETPTLVLEEI